VVDGPPPDGVPVEWQSPAGGLRTRPDHWAGRGGIDGFYMLCFRCIAAAT
jgi:16S rRNA (cytosine967-C5)-methyltransferase